MYFLCVQYLCRQTRLVVAHPWNLKGPDVLSHFFSLLVYLLAFSFQTDIEELSNGYGSVKQVARTTSTFGMWHDREKECEKIRDRVKGARNHLYWCATSTKEGFQELIAAKWKSFMQHVANNHDNHTSPLFAKCAHDDQIEDRQWIKTGKVIIV